MAISQAHKCMEQIHPTSFNIDEGRTMKGPPIYVHGTSRHSLQLLGRSKEDTISFSPQEFGNPIMKNKNTGISKVVRWKVGMDEVMNYPILVILAYLAII